MLWTPKQSFSWEVDNFSSFSGTFGTSVTPGTNTKGTPVAVLNNTAQDAYGVTVCFGVGGTSGSARGHLADILVDPANGTNWQTLIPNLCFSGVDMSHGGYWYYFPVFIPKGSAVGCQGQVNSGTTAFRVGLRLVGQPSRPDAIQVGSFVRAFNAATGTSFGTTAITPVVSGADNDVYVNIGTTADQLWFWQSGMVINDGTMTGGLSYITDLALGDGTNMQRVIRAQAHICGGTSERVYNGQPYMNPSCYFAAPSGIGVYARGSCTGGTADSNIYVCAYGVGG